MSVIRSRINCVQQRALRFERADLPWIFTVKLLSSADISLLDGAEMSLLNISRTGLLVESASKFAPGTVCELQLGGAGTELPVRVRFVRSEVASVDQHGVKYHAAAVFEKELDLEALLLCGEASPRPKRAPSAADASVATSVFRPRFSSEQRAPRFGRPDLPWISTSRLLSSADISLLYSADVSLLNISRTGLLMESGSKFAPGTVCELQLGSADTGLPVRVRFIRSEVASVDQRGVKYHAAAVFEEESELLHLLTIRSEGSGRES